MTRGRLPQDVMTEDVTSGSVGFPPLKKARARRNTADGFGTIMKAVSDGIARTAKSAGPVALTGPEAIGAVVRGALRGSLGVAPNALVGTKAIVMGVLRGTDEEGDAALVTLSHAARAILRQTAEMRGDMGAAARGVILGAISSARHMRVYPPRAASAARQAVLDEAGRIGSEAAERVRGALKHDVDESAVLPRGSTSD